MKNLLRGAGIAAIVSLVTDYGLGDWQWWALVLLLNAASVALDSKRSES